MVPLTTVIENAAHAIIETRKVLGDEVGAAHDSIKADDWPVMTSIVTDAFREAGEIWNTLSPDERRISA